MLCYETMIRLLYSLKKMGVKAINWTGGGEPLVNPNLPRTIEAAHDLGFDQGIFTNGLLLKEDVGKALIGNMTWIRISLDGHDEESYAKSHGTSRKSWGVVIENIRKLASITPRRCTIGIGFIITEHNYQGIWSVARLAKLLGVDYIQFKPVVFRPGHKQMSKEFITSNINPLLEEVKRLEDTNFNVMISQYRFNDVMDAPLHGRHYKQCLSHHFQGAIGADSKVYLCDHHKGEKEYELGDLSVNSLEEIWSSDKRKSVIAWLDSTDLSQCQSCCRNHELNKLLWSIKNPDPSMHPNHI